MISASWPCIFTSSRPNSTSTRPKVMKFLRLLRKDNIILRVKENPEHDIEFYEDQEKDWLTLAYSSNKVTVLDLVESEVEFQMNRKAPFLVGLRGLN